MAGGVAILVLVLVLLVAGAIALALYGTGGVLWARSADPRGDRAGSPVEERVGERRERRRQHARPTAPARQRTHFAGAGERERRR